MVTANLSPVDLSRHHEPLDVHSIRHDFPVMELKVHGKPLIYLDNAASTQKPRVMIEATAKAYTQIYANIHRGVHWLSQQATEQYENARETVRAFLHAKDSKEIIFVRGATEAINLVAHSFPKNSSRKGMRFSSPRWSIIPILSPGKWYAKSEGRCSR